MQLFNILIFFVIFVQVFGSSFFNFGRKTTTTTRAPQNGLSSSTSRCDFKTSQCSAYECCNSNQSCIKNRCFPRLSNCPVTRDQCGNTCCQASYTCRNGLCSK